MKCLIGVFLLIVIAECYANLEVRVDGVVTDSRDFCSNQMLVFVCTLPTSAFEWRAGALIPDGQGQVTVGNTEIVGNITLTAEGIAENRTSTLEVATSTDLNGVMVTCFDPGNPGQQLVATVRVYDPLSSSISVTATTDYRSSVSLTVRPEVEAVANCTSAYRIQVNNFLPLDEPTNGSVEITITDLGARIMEPLDLCTTCYNISVSAIARVDGSVGAPNLVTFPTPMNVFQTFFHEGVTNDSAVVRFVASFICINAIIQASVTPSEGSEIKPVSLNATSITISDLMPEMNYIVELCVMLPGMSKKVACQSTSFRTNQTAVTPFSSTAVSTAGGTTTPGSSSFPTGGIIGICVGVVVALLVLTVIIILSCCCCPPCSDNRVVKNDCETLEASGPSVHDAKLGTDGTTSEDVLPTYQDPQSIKREAAGQSGDVYTVVEKKKKGSKKKGSSEDVPMYSVVDKDAKQQEGLVYADIDVKNPTRSSRSRPPPPPGVTQLDANEPVVYSTVETAKH